MNINSLLTVRTQFQYRADLMRAIIEIAIEHEGEPWLDPHSGLELMPRAGELPTFVKRHASPVRDAYFPPVAHRPTADAFADAYKLLARDS